MRQDRQSRQLRASHTVVHGGLPLAVAVTVVVVAGGAFALGSGSRDPPPAAATTVTAAAPERSAPTAVPPECLDSASDALDELRSLGSRLKVGLNVGSYTDRVGDLQVAVDDATDQDDGACSDAIDLIGQATDIHSAAASEWENCIDEYPHCFVDSVGIGEKSTSTLRVFRLGVRWERADRVVRGAARAVDALG